MWPKLRFMTQAPMWGKLSQKINRRNLNAYQKSIEREKKGWGGDRKKITNNFKKFILFGLFHSKLISIQ